MKQVKVGTIFVDAGVCYLGDPCYVMAKGCSSRFEEDWNSFCKEVLFKGESPHSTGNFNFDWKPGKGLAVIVPTGYGDGEYPVYVEVNNEGRVMSVTVRFE